MRFAFLCVVSLVLALTSAAPGHAGSNGRPVDQFTLQESAEFSKAIERELAARGAYVAMVFRTGRPREDLPEGIRYTHGAFWVYTPIETRDGRTIYGYVVFNLYHELDPVTVSGLYQDWPLDFTRGDVIGQAGVIIPVPEMQRRILDVIASDTFDHLHQSEYALLSNPADLRYQNCTEFMLDVVSAAAWETSDRDQIKVNLDAYFNPSRIELNFFERLAAPWIDPRIRLDDQGPIIETATYGSMADFMLAFGLASQDGIFELNAEHGLYAPTAPATSSY